MIEVHDTAQSILQHPLVQRPLQGASSNSSRTEFIRHVPTTGMYQSKSLFSIGMHAPTKISIFTKFTKDAPQASRGEDHKSYSWGGE